MLGALFGLIIVIFGVVLYFDPDARGVRDKPEAEPVNGEVSQ
jgi:hypothetical protein